MSAAAIGLHLLCALAVFALSVALTRVMIAVNLADVPNHRSSHARPTPKSGGLAIAGAYFLGTCALFIVSASIRLDATAFSIHLTLAFLLLCAGLADDIHELKPLIKLALQIAIAIAFAAGVAHIETLPLPFVGRLTLGPFGIPLTVLWIVALMNLINFMDGINGLVSGSALIAGAVLALIAARADAPFVYLSALILVGATAGFFVFNFPGGRIFLGDTGSTFIAYIFATLAVIGSTREGGHLSLYVVPILLSPLLFDAVITLLARARRGARLWEAHREHLYQRLTKSGLSHASVSALYFALALIAGGGAVLAQIGVPTDGPWVLAGLAGIYALFALWALRYVRRRGGNIQTPSPIGRELG
jgi:UDP-GlcNAc:undecaprenyl-phosphate GlcNAc-1-phosphate transferase